MKQLGAVETQRKDRIVGLYSRAHELGIGGNYVQALELYDRIIADAPELVVKTPQINYERALCLKALGRIDQAEQAVCTCLVAKPGHPDSLRLLSEIKSIKEGCAEAKPRLGAEPGAAIVEDAEKAHRLWAEVRTFLPLVEEADVRRALRAISEIEEKIKGRCCGDLRDKLAQYLSIVQFARTSGLETFDSIEIGTLFGGSCLARLFAMRDLGVGGKIVCIDPMSGYYEQQIDPKAGIAVTAEVFFENIARFGFAREAVDLRQAKSSDRRATEGLRERSFATLLIDGDHSYQSVRYDWENYSKFVSGNGIVLFDDYTNGAWPDIAVFADELKGSMPGGWKELGCLGTTLLLGRSVEDGSEQEQVVDKEKIYEGLNKCYFSDQCHEREVIEHLPELLDGVKVFVDIGASLGQYTFHANKYMEEGEIFAIEADPIRFEELKRNCRKWESFSSNQLTALFAAVCEKDGRETFYATNSSKSGGLFKRDICGEPVNWCATVVDCFRLDSLFKNSSPDLVKIDVEGAELRVLRGATRILSEGKTKFLIELHSGVDPEGQSGPDEVLEFMGSFGYTSRNLYGRTLFVNEEKANIKLRACGNQSPTVAVRGQSNALSNAPRNTLGEFASKYAGKRAFIIGNGPSLNEMDLTKLKDEVTFGVNNIFYLVPRMGFKPTFYVVEDKLVAEDRAEEINSLTGMTKIFGTELQYCLKDSQDVRWANVVYDFSDYPGFPHFSKDASECLWVGGTVSYLCMQLAYYMGFSEVYLVGFDHNYIIPTDANIEGTVITSVSADRNHFHPDYFGKGRRWHDPRPERMEKAYRRAREVFEANGRKIFNATVGGKLEIFPRVDCESLFSHAGDRGAKSFDFCSTGPSNRVAVKNELAVKQPQSPRFSHLVLDFTRLCNSRCTYCGIWKMRDGPELSLETIERTFSGLRAYGLSTCYVTGGEPYISDKIVDIARLLHVHLPKCKLSGATNGVQPKKILERMQKILQMGISLEVHVSINGGEAAHDATRGGPGFWKKSAYLLETLKSAGVPVVASMSLMPQTIADLPYMQRFCAERDIRLMFSWVRQWERYGSVDKEHSTWPERMKARLREIEYLPDTFDCPGLSKRLVVTPEGSVYPCEVYNPKILLGNVNEGSLESMLASSRTDSIARLIAERGCTWCQGPGEVDGSPKWMLMDCYRRHSQEYAHLAKQFPQAVNMAPEESSRVIESILSEKSIHRVPTAIMQQSAENRGGGKNSVRISAVICTYRNPELLGSAIESLVNQTLHCDLFEIIVVDNNSGDSTKQVVERHPGVRYVLEGKLGLSQARNAGIRAACGDIIAFIDDDAEACRGWLAALLRVYDAVPEAWAVGGKVLPIWDAEKPEWLTEEYYRALSLLEWGEVERPLHWPERIIGTNCSFRREVFATSGDFDTCLGRLGSCMLSFEDTEVQRRINQTGHLVYYIPEAVVHHHVPAWRMTEEYICRRSSGNTLSEMLVVLRDGGKGEEARRFVDRFHDMASEFTDESGGPIEAQIMGRVYSEFMQVHGDVPVAIKAEFARILGRYYSQRERFEEAERRFTEGLSLDGLGEEQACKILVELGKVYLNQDRYDEAEQKFGEAMSLGVADGETRFDLLEGLGSCCGQRGCCAEMAKRFDEILALAGISEKNKVDAMRSFGRYYFKHQRYAEAEQLYSRMLGKVHGKGRYHVLKGLGASYCMQGRIAEMRRTLDEILTSGNISVECKVDAVLSFAKYYSSCGRYEEVEQLCLRVLGQARGKEKYHLLKALGSCYEVQGRYSEAEEKFNDAASIEGIDAGERFWVVVGLAKCELGQDRYAGARQRYEELFSSSHCPNQQKVVLAREFANYHAARGQREKVVEIYKRVCCLKGLVEEEKTAFAQMVKVAISKVETDGKQEDSKMKGGDAVGSSIRISVVVCTYQNPELLGKTLESLIQQSLERKLYEVIVVDNNSGDSTKEVVSRYPDVRYILEERLGLSYARNRGIQAARADIIAFIDDDAEASTGWLEALLEVYDSVAEAWAVGGKVLPIWDAKRPEWLTQRYYRSLSLVEWGEAARPLSWPERIIGTNCSFRRQVFADIGLFDTELGRVGRVLLGEEDREIQQRIGRQGHFVYYTPKAVVYHHVPASRMTKEYLQRRSEGTVIAEKIMALRSEGKDRQAEEIANQIRQSAKRTNFVGQQQKALAESNLKLGQYKDKHRGQRCVIVGNGPSLNKMDLSFLKNEITFGMNRIYLLSDKWDFRPTYYVSVNPLVIEQSADQICRITSPKFLGLNGLPYTQNHRGNIFLQSIRRPSFSKDPRNGLWEGHTVTYVAMQLAYFMGFSEVILIGVDHYFKTKGAPNKEIVSEGVDENHFHPDYFGKGVRWNLPDLEKSEIAYRLAKQAFEAGGRRIIDVTVDGHLTIFPKADYKEIFFAASPSAQLGKVGLSSDVVDTEFEEYLMNEEKAESAFSGGAVPNLDSHAGTERQGRYLVSAIVSTYNSEHFLRGCLEDLACQTIADKLEIVVVNSGSEQNEEAIVKEFQQKCDNIVYIKTEQREGIYAAWDRAIQAARGMFITNANTDDRHREDALEIMARTLQSNPDVALVYGDQICTDTPNGTFDNHHAAEMAKRPDYSRQRLLFGCCVGSQPMWRKSLHNEFGYFDEGLTSAGDWDFWLRISSKYGFKHIPEFLGLYYYNKEGIEHGRKIHSLYERYIVGKRYGNPYISVIPLYRSKDNPLVSVIMPAYNAAEYIAEAIESVLIQNYRNFELIIVDDGSTDNTKDIVAGFKDDKIKYFYKQNAGPSSARNLAIKRAKGQYIMPLDSDDMMTPDFIASHLQEFERYPEADLVYSDVLLIDAGSNPIRVMKKPEYQDRRHMIKDLFRAGHPVIPFRLGVRKSVFDKIGFYDEKLMVAEDYDMMRRFVKHGLRVHHLSGALHMRRMTDSSLSRNLTLRNAKCHFEVVRRFIDTFSYDELFPDVQWEQIGSGNRRLHAKCLAAVTCLAIGQSYVNTNSPNYAKTAFELACSQLNDCLEMAPGNRQVRQLLHKSECIMARCDDTAAGGAFVESRKMQVKQATR